MERTELEKIAYAAGKKAGQGRKGKAKAKPKAKGKKPYRKPYSRPYGGGGNGRAAVVYPSVYGYGDYKMNANDSLGTQWGGYLGAKGGEFLGGAAQQLLSTLTGFGDYSVKSNVLLAPELPTIINDSVKGGITFRHKEYLRDIITSGTAGAFNLDSYLLNPGNSKTFPWLSQVAQNFEQYSLEGVIFEFRSMSADALNSTNTALGTVIMATNYDSLDTNFKGKGEMENYEWGMSCKPSVNMLHPIECAPRQTSITELYVLDGPVPSGADPRLYHWGNMQIATTGFQGTSVNIGELWVTYQVRLLKGRIFQAIGLEIGTYIASNAVYTNALPLGPNLDSYVVDLDTIGMIIDPANRNIGFPINGVRKAYVVYIQWTGTIAAYTFPSYTLTDCTMHPSYNPSSITGPASGESCTRANVTIGIIVEANDFAVITVGAAGVLPNATTGVRFRITEINPGDN